MMVRVCVCDGEGVCDGQDVCDGEGVCMRVCDGECVIFQIKYYNMLVHVLIVCFHYICIMVVVSFYLFFLASSLKISLLRMCSVMSQSTIARSSCTRKFDSTK